jgi:hypothetical protein
MMTEISMMIEILMMIHDDRNIDDDRNIVLIVMYIILMTRNILLHCYYKSAQTFELFNKSSRSAAETNRTNLENVIHLFGRISCIPNYLGNLKNLFEQCTDD